MQLTPRVAAPSPFSSFYFPFSGKSGHSLPEATALRRITHLGEM
jgi:hypothetical protein